MLRSHVQKLKKKKHACNASVFFPGGNISDHLPYASETGPDLFSPNFTSDGGFSREGDHWSTDLPLRRRDAGDSLSFAWRTRTAPMESVPEVVEAVFFSFMKGALFEPSSNRLSSGLGTPAEPDPFESEGVAVFPGVYPDRELLLTVEGVDSKVPSLLVAVDLCPPLCWGIVW